MRRQLAALAALTTLLVLVGCGSSHHLPYKTTPRPTLPPSFIPPPSACQHHMGGCLPHPKTVQPTPPPKLLFGASGIAGPDLSNNDPVGRSGIQAIAGHNRFLYVKSVEGTGFTDSTAAFMAAFSKTFGLPVGGYDFQHVCGNSPQAEASHFVNALRAQGLLGKGTLPPAGDSEFRNGACGGRSWLQTWVNTVYANDGHVCPIDYTGAWWWNPNIGAFWPTCNGHQLLSWISGYGVSFPFMPSGLSHLDFWQYTDRGFNGASSGDMSVWRNGETAFRTFARQRPPGPSQATIRTWRHQREAAFRVYHSHGCRSPQTGNSTPASFGVPNVCRDQAAIVVGSQTRLWTVYKRWACFGPQARTRSEICWIVRPEASYASHARNATRRALRAHGCRQPYRRRVCRALGQRDRYFTSKVSSITKQYS